MLIAQTDTVVANSQAAGALLEKLLAAQSLDFGQAADAPPPKPKPEPSKPETSTRASPEPPRTERRTALFSPPGSSNSSP